MKKNKCYWMALLFLVGFSLVDSAEAITCKRVPIKAGDTLESITNEYTGNPKNWRELIMRKTVNGNEWVSPENPPRAKEILWLVKSKITNYPSTPYVMKKGDSLKSIAQFFTGNQLDSKELIFVKTPSGLQWINAGNFSSFKPGDQIQIVNLKNIRFKPEENIPGSFVQRDESPSLKESTQEEGIRTEEPSSPKESPPKQSGIRINNDMLGSVDASLWAHYQTNLHSGKSRKGTGWGGQIDFSPILVEINGQLVKMGPAFKIDRGDVTVGEDTYVWDKRGIGVFAKTDFDARHLRGQLFLTKQETYKEGSPGEQTTKSWEGEIELNDKTVRQAGGTWLTAKKISLSHRQPFDTKGGTYNEGQTEGRGRITLVDIPLTKEEHAAIEAEFLLGRSKGKESWYGGIGAGVSIGNKTTDFARISVLPVEYFSNKGSSVLKVLGFFNPNGTFRAIQAAGVKKIEEENETTVTSLPTRKESH